MPRQVRKQPEATEKKKSEESEETAEVLSKTESKSPEALKAEMDALLDEIEEVLTENAAEFVNSYVQKGGQ